MNMVKLFTMEKDLMCCIELSRTLLNVLFLNQNAPVRGGNCSVFLLSVSSSKEEYIFGVVNPLKAGRLPNHSA